MALKRVPLHHAVDKRSAVYVRELTGLDEQAIASNDTLAAVELIDRVCVNVGEDGLVPGQAIDLTAHDRDRILAALYDATYGPEVQGVASCETCARSFDFSFALGDLVANIDQERSGATAAPLDYVPTGRDELALTDLSSADAVRTLAQRCLGNATLDEHELEERLAEEAPILALDLDATCPECGAVRTIAFDIQSALLGSLLDERYSLSREIHRLALTYRWSLSDILSLPRGQRQRFADLAANVAGSAT